MKKQVKKKRIKKNTTYICSEINNSLFIFLQFIVVLK